MANNVKIMHKSNHISEKSGRRFAIDTYTGKAQTGPMVLKPTKDLKQWLKEADELYAREARKQA